MRIPKEGDEVDISIAGESDFKLARDLYKTSALEQLRQMKWSFPPDFKFEREEINARNDQ
jgi:antitoxin MazE